MKLEDLLKKQGFTDADIQGAATLLGDARFRGAVEGYTQTLEGENVAFRQENDRWADWAEQVNKPQLEGLQREKLDLVSKAGSLEARLQALDPSFKPGQNPPSPTPAGTPALDENKFLTRETFDTEVARYAAGQGEAIAIANDLASEYRRLTGSDILDNIYRTSDGRELRGMHGLLHEARANKVPLPDYIERKFDFAGKRAKSSEDARKAAEDAVRKDERAKVLSEYGNPNTRPMVPSQNPFIPVRTGEGTGQQPWERGTPAQLRTSRIARNVESQARSTVN